MVGRPFCRQRGSITAEELRTTLTQAGHGKRKETTARCLQTTRLCHRNTQKIQFKKEVPIYPIKVAKGPAIHRCHIMKSVLDDKFNLHIFHWYLLYEAVYIYRLVRYIHIRGSYIYRLSQNDAQRKMKQFLSLKSFKFQTMQAFEPQDYLSWEKALVLWQQVQHLRPLIVR